MKVLGKAVQAIMRRPFILVYFGFIALVYSIIDTWNPLTALLMGFNRLGKGDLLDMIIYSIQIFLNIMSNPQTALKALIVFIFILLFVSIVIGLIFSGYFNIVNNAVAKKEKYKGENPVLIRVETRAGHGAGKPTSKVIEEVADLWSFVFYNLKMTPKY